MRIACLDLPALPLQILWRREPAWREFPTVVVDDDRPQGKVLWACDRARALRILPGLRFSHALALAPELRAAVVSAEEQAVAVDAVAARLHTRSPEIMRDPDEPGTFWLGGAGLASIYPSASAWGRAIAEDVAALGLAGAIVVGFSRFATCALARGLGHGLVIGAAVAHRAALPPVVRVFACDADERAAVRAVPLDRYGVEPRLREALARLSVRTLGDLIQLPHGGILERFGTAAHRLYQLAQGEGWDPIAPEPPPEAIDERIFLDDPERDAERLVFATKAALDRLLVRLADKRRALTALSVELELQLSVGNHERRVDCIRPAAPTLDGRSLLNLVRLRLEHQPPKAGVIAIRVWADDLAATSEQLALFAARPRRDRRAADAALARLRAELGDAAVVRPVLRSGHLPEHRFGWERTDHVVSAAPRPDRPRHLVRRIFPHPRPLPPPSPHLRDDGWTLDVAHGSVKHIVGPYLVSGGWWGNPVEREYHFAETTRGDCLWLYVERTGLWSYQLDTN